MKQKEDEIGTSALFAGGSLFIFNYKKSLKTDLVYLWNKLKKCIRQYNCYPIEINSTQEFAIFAESRNLNRNQNENGIDE